jgi:alkaline phosphatase D
MKKITLFLVFMTFALGFSQSNLTLDPCLKPFYHGIASGDPLKDRVIIWTRVTPDDISNVTITGTWKIATDNQMSNVISSGSFTTDTSKDFTVKIDVTGLQAQTYYYYQFHTNGLGSPIGRTKTAPGDTTTNARFGVVSCANLEAGFFNVYKAMNVRNDIDAVLCLGDYIYEYETGGYEPNTATQRFWQPATETITLADYRARYSVYHLDPDLRRNHQLYPWIPIWDDHESANDSWKDGAENHNTGEGNWQTRKNDGKQAYFEWLPIRQTNPTDPYQIYREITYGKTIDLIMLDTRLEGREEQIGTTGTSVNSTTRKMISDAQKIWMNDKLLNTTSKWKFLVQQVMMAPVKIFGSPMNEDQWNGYPAERDNLSNFIVNNNINNFVVLTGDIHTSWANDLPRSNYVSSTGAGSWGVEFVTPSVTSPGGPVELIFGNSFVKYKEGSKKGFIILDVTAPKVQADWYYVNTINTSSSTHQVGASWYVLDTENHLRQATNPILASTAITNVIQPDLCFTQILNTNQISEEIKILSLYPNPSDAFFTIHYNINESGTVHLKIIDLTGKEIKKFTTSKHSGIWTERYPTDDLPNGTYIVTITSDNSITTQKLIISH